MLSPLAWLLVYQFPVHLIGPGHRPEAAEEPTCLVVYRDRDDKVQFVAINAAVARLVELIRENTAGASVESLLHQLAQEMHSDPQAILGFGADQVAQFIQAGIVLIRNP